MKEKRCSPGEQIVSQGDIGEIFFLLISGTCDSFKDGQKSRTYDQPGEYFGEVALLSEDRIRVATVVARSEATVAMIDREAFNRLLGPLEDILKRTQYEPCEL